MSKCACHIEVTATGELVEIKDAAARRDIENLKTEIAEFKANEDSEAIDFSEDIAAINEKFNKYVKEPAGNVVTYTRVLSRKKGAEKGDIDYLGMSEQPEYSFGVLRDSKGHILLRSDLDYFGELNAINKKYADTLYVPLTNANNKVYGSDGNGEVKYYNVASNLGSGCIVMRTSAQQINVPDEPTNDSNATSKVYVDTAIARASLGDYANGKTYAHMITLQGQQESSPYTSYEIKLTIMSPYVKILTSTEIKNIISAHIGQFMTLRAMIANEFTQLPLIHFVAPFNQMYFGMTNNVDNPEKIITITSFTDSVTSI